MIPSLWGLTPNCRHLTNPDGAKRCWRSGLPDGFSEVTVLAVDENGMVLEIRWSKRCRSLCQPVQRPYNPDGEEYWRGDGELSGRYRPVAGRSVGDWSAYLVHAATANFLCTNLAGRVTMAIDKPGTSPSICGRNYNPEVSENCSRRADDRSSPTRTNLPTSG
jgi:hypothetical protein